MKRLSVAIIGFGLVAACGTGQAGSLRPGPAAPPSAGNAAVHHPGQGSAVTTRRLGLEAWFTRQGKLFVTRRAVPATAGVGRAALNALLAGPSAAERVAGLRSQIPAGTRILGLSISTGTATVDLSSPFGAAASSPARFRIAQVVYTLTQFPTVARVRFEVNGQNVVTIGGVSVRGPQTPAMYGSSLPAITVQNPVIGERVTSPVTVSGTADVFEGTVSVRVLNSAGHEIARTFTTATCGTGCRGRYSVPVRCAVPRQEPGTIEVYETSMENGQHLFAQLIPVTLRP